MNSNLIIIFRQFINISDSNPELILLAAIPHEEGFEEYDYIEDALKTDFHLKQYFVIVTASSITAFSLICSYYFIKTIVSIL